MLCLGGRRVLHLKVWHIIWKRKQTKIALLSDDTDRFSMAGWALWNQYHFKPIQAKIYSWPSAHELKTLDATAARPSVWSKLDAFSIVKRRTEIAQKAFSYGTTMYRYKIYIMKKNPNSCKPLVWKNNMICAFDCDSSHFHPLTSHFNMNGPPQLNKMRGFWLLVSSVQRGESAKDFSYWSVLKSLLLNLEKNILN